MYKLITFLIIFYSIGDCQPIFYGNIDWDKSKIDNDTLNYFYQEHILNSEVDRVNFKKEVNYERCYFDNFRILNSNYNNGLNFFICTFNSDFYVNSSNSTKIHFEYCKFKTVGIYHVECDSLILKNNSSIKLLHISKCKIKKSLDFSEFVVLKNLLIEDVDFVGKVNFDQTKFENSMVFDNVTFKDYVDFRDVTLPDSLTFRNVKSERLIDLRFSKVENICNISLSGSDLNKFLFDYSKFRLSFSKSESNDSKSNVYKGLLDNFKNQGMTDSYYKLDLEYKKFQANIGNLSDKFFYYLQYYWWEYGYQKWWIFLWIIGFLIIFTIIVFLKFQYLNEHIYTIQFIERFTTINKRKIHNHKYYYRLLCSFIYCIVLFFGLKINYEEIKFINRWTIYIFFVYFTGLICTAYLFNFIISK